MSKIIVFNQENKMRIITPVDDNDIENLGKNTVSKGVKFWIIDSSELPEDKTYRDAWFYDGSDELALLGETDD